MRARLTVGACPPTGRPLTHLSPTGDSEKLEVDDAVIHVVDVKPRIAVSTSAPERAPLVQGGDDRESQEEGAISWKTCQSGLDAMAAHMKSMAAEPTPER